MNGAGRSRPAWIVRWGPVLLYGMGIFLLSSIPARSFPQRWSSLWSYDKVVHAILFAGLAAVLYRALALSAAGARAAILWIAAVVLASGYGVLDEIHQRFTPGRSSDPKDALADLIGASAGALVALLVYRRRR